jgi:hypothetical protein
LITLISAIACAIIKCNDEDTITILAASFTQLGDTLATYLTQQGILDKRAQECEDKNNKNKDNKNKNINSNNNNNNDNNNNKGNKDCKEDE